MLSKTVYRHLRIKATSNTSRAEGPRPAADGTSRTHIYASVQLGQADEGAPHGREPHAMEVGWRQRGLWPRAERSR